MAKEHGASRNRAGVKRSCPKFSFIIPAYAEPGDFGAITKIGRCIESIKAQTEPSYHIVLVSDGPSDVMYALYEGFRKELGDHIAYIEAPYVGQRGGHHSVDVGKHLCLGEYTTVLNGDNVLRPEYIEKLYHPQADVLYCSVRMNDMPGITVNPWGCARNVIDRLNYSIRTAIVKKVRHKMHLDADYDFLLDCIQYRQQTARVREYRVEDVLAEHN